MNQPHSSCISYIAEIAALQTSLSSELQPAAMGHLEMQNTAFQSPNNGDANNFQQGNDWDPMAVDDSESVGPITTSNDQASAMTTTFEPIIKEYPGAAQTYGKGKAFLDDFNADAYAEQHAINLYYPFSTKEEWELALFLLVSGMSMATITKFLSLKLVCIISVNLHAN